MEYYTSITKNGGKIPCADMKKMSPYIDNVKNALENTMNRMIPFLQQLVVSKWTAKIKFRKS